MQFALISDIHGNYKALEAFFAYIDKREVDGIICLGDYLTDSPYPQRTISMLYEMREKYPCHMVRGNREEYLIDNFYHPKGWKPSSTSGALYYTSQHITETDIRFLEGLPAVRELAIPGCPPTLICHGAPSDIRGNLTENPKLKEESLRNLKEDYLFGGHSHNQETDEQFGKIYVNPGSLGLAIDKRGRHAQFAMLHTKEGESGLLWQVEQISLSYDVDAFLQDFTVSGLDEYGMILNRAVKKTLVTGINYFYDAVIEAARIAEKPLWEIPESVWQQVADRLSL